MERFECRSYNEAINQAIEWLKVHGAATLDEAYEARKGGFGMRTLDKSSGYRLEFDLRSGTHINTWSAKTKGPHYTFPGNEQDIRAKWKQLYFWDPRLRKRTQE
jgi:hypothetical protein